MPAPARCAANVPATPPLRTDERTEAHILRAEIIRIIAVVSEPPLARGPLALILRKVTLLFLAALVLAGAYDALRNLPVLSGCNFYADCPREAGGDPDPAFGTD